MLSVTMLNVVMLCVVAPLKELHEAIDIYVEWKTMIFNCETLTHKYQTKMGMITNVKHSSLLHKTV